jgi:pimeloyl-ACP methyl ester carboxylesterase
VGKVGEALDGWGLGGAREEAPQRRHHMQTEHLRILARGLVGLVVLIVILAVVGYVYEHYASKRDMKCYPPPGQLIQVENHKLHLYCTGSGSPTVILEAAAQSSSLDWSYVQPPIAQLTRACSYDRAGFGWSELGPQPLAVQYAADELHSLLNKAGEQGPYIFVGASYGGHIVRLFAHDYPEQVSGVILVDARPEELLSIAAIQRQARSMLVFSRILAFLGEFGLSRPFIAAMPEKMIPSWAVPVYNSHPGSYEIVFQHKFLHTMYAEAQGMETSDAQVAAVGPMGDTPLIVIRHGKPRPSGTEETEQKWQAFQEEIARQSSAGQIIVAEASGHGIQGEQPAIIVEAVQQLLKRPSMGN